MTSRIQTSSLSLSSTVSPYLPISPTFIACLSLLPLSHYLSFLISRSYSSSLVSHIKDKEVVKMALKTSRIKTSLSLSFSVSPYLSLSPIFIAYLPPLSLSHYLSLFISLFYSSFLLSHINDKKKSQDDALDGNILMKISSLSFAFSPSFSSIFLPLSLSLSLSHSVTHSFPLSLSLCLSFYN